MKNFFQQIGAIRVLLAFFVISTLPYGSLSDSIEPEGVIGIIGAYVMPSVSLIFVFILALDATMNRIFMAERTHQENQSKRTVIKLNLILLFLLVICWIPFYKTLF